MKLYIFRCRARPRMYGATRYETPSNLPTQKCTAGWEFYQRVDLTSRETLRFAVDTATVRRHIEQRGWHVWDESPREVREKEVQSKPLPPEEKQQPIEVQPARREQAQEPSWNDALKKIEAEKPLESIRAETPESATSRRESVIAARAPSVTSREPVVSPRGAVVTPRDPVIAPREPVTRREPVVSPRDPVVAPRDPVIAPREPSVLARKPIEVLSSREPVESTKDPSSTRIPKLPAHHQVVWFDIPVRDMDRAIRFYSAVLGTPLRKEQSGPGTAMVVLPHREGSVGGSLVQSLDGKPSDSGPLLYLNTYGRLDEVLKEVEKNGGRVVSERHSIAPYGFRAIVLDSEGNRIALHSM